MQITLMSNSLQRKSKTDKQHKRQSILHDNEVHPNARQRSLTPMSQTVLSISKTSTFLAHVNKSVALNRCSLFHFHRMSAPVKLKRADDWSEEKEAFVKLEQECDDDAKKVFKVPCCRGGSIESLIRAIKECNILDCDRPEERQEHFRS